MSYLKRTTAKPHLLVLTPRNPRKTEDQTPIQTIIFTKLLKNKEKERPNPKEDAESQTKMCARFDWTDTLLTQAVKQAKEDILVEYHDIFARERIDLGINTAFKLKLTTKDVYCQNFPMSIHPKDNLIVKLDLMYQNGIFTVLLSSEYASPIVAKRKPNGKLHLLVDLMKINSLMEINCTKKSHPVGILSNVPEHLEAALLSSLSLLADGGRVVSGDGCIQFR